MALDSGLSQGGPFHIMANPNRGRGGLVNGRGGSHSQNNGAIGADQQSAPPAPPAAPNGHLNGTRGKAPMRGTFGSARGGLPLGPLGPPRGGFNSGFRGRGFMNVDRGRGGPPRGGFRGRGRGNVAAPMAL